MSEARRESGDSGKKKKKKKSFLDVFSRVSASFGPYTLLRGPFSRCVLHSLPLSIGIGNARSRSRSPTLTPPSLFSLLPAHSSSFRLKAQPPSSSSLGGPTLTPYY